MSWRRAVAPDDSFERERQLWLAFQSRDRDRIEALIDSEAIDVGPAGILNREEVLVAVDAMQIESFVLDDVRVLRIGSDVELVVARSAVAGTYKGRPFPSSHVRSTSVWSCDSGAWRLIHRVECPESA